MSSVVTRRAFGCCPAPELIWWRPLGYRLLAFCEKKRENAGKKKRFSSVQRRRGDQDLGLPLYRSFFFFFLLLQRGYIEKRGGINKREEEQPVQVRRLRSPSCSSGRQTDGQAHQNCCWTHPSTAFPPSSSSQFDSGRRLDLYYISIHITAEKSRILLFFFFFFLEKWASFVASFMRA